MKRFFILTLIFVLLLTGCATAQPEDSSSVTEGSESQETTAAEAKPYCIVYPSGADASIRQAAMDIWEYIQMNSGVSLELYSDSKAPTSDYEILIGDTNRVSQEEWYRTAKNDGWWVLRHGNYIVVNGASNRGFANATDYFLLNYTQEGDKIRLEEEKCKLETREDPLIAAGIKLRVATYNIKNGSGVNHNMSVLGEQIKALNLDVVGLQEVDVGTDRAQGLDTLRLLAESAGFPYYRFAKAIDFQGGEYGTAVMSKYPIQSFEVQALPTDAGLEARAVGHATIEINGSRIDFFNTHLSYESATVRQKQFNVLKQLRTGTSGFIMTADFNTESLKELTCIPHTVLVNQKSYHTYETSAIDDIILEENWSVVSSGVVKDTKGLSDHNLLWAEIAYTGGKEVPR